MNETTWTLKKHETAQILNDFLFRLCRKYDMETVTEMWIRLQDMCRDWFWNDADEIAKIIKAYPDDAEEALKKYHKAPKAIAVEQRQPDPEPEAEWIRVEPGKKSWLKRLAIAAGILVLIFAGIVALKAGSAIRESDAVIAEADRVLEGYGR